MDKVVEEELYAKMKQQTLEQILKTIPVYELKKLVDEKFKADIEGEENALKISSRLEELYANYPKEFNKVYKRVERERKRNLEKEMTFLIETTNPEWVKQCMQQVDYRKAEDLVK